MKFDQQLTNLLTALRAVTDDKERQSLVRRSIQRLRQIEAHRCDICNNTGWNHGAQPGPMAGYRTVRCKCRAGSNP